jgi:hypothetical protein
MKRQFLVILLIVSMLLVAECAAKRKPSRNSENSLSRLTEEEFKTLYRDSLEKKDKAPNFFEQTLWERGLERLQSAYQAKFGSPLTV